MNVRKLLDWRALFIYSHRWLGILVGLVFVAWCVSGIVLMYYGVPHLTAGERLMRLPPLDLSTVRVPPADAAAHAQGRPFRLRISMHGSRPVYRINTGQVFGRWTVVYADTGEVMSGLDRDAATAWLHDYLPESPALRYDAYLTGPDTFTRIPALQTHMPMHRIALDDAAGTEYYVSERSGEAVMKTTTPRLRFRVPVSSPAVVGHRGDHAARGRLRVERHDPGTDVPPAGAACAANRAVGFRSGGWRADDERATQSRCGCGAGGGRGHARLGTFDPGPDAG
jgi:hypothetical protein